MPAFRYEAVDAQGATRKGVLNADSPRSARAELRVQGLVPLAVEPIAAQVDAAGVTKRRGFGERLSSTELALFTRQLASLLEAGLPLEQAFSALLEQAERPYLRDLIASIRSEVIGGAAFSDVLARHPRDFAEIYRALVASGEQIGHLSRVLSRLADYIERRNALVQKVKLAFTYPAIVTVVAFSIVIFLLTYVVPQIVSVFANTKQKLPMLTVIMLALSDFVRHYGIVVAIALVGAWFAWRRALQQPALKRRWHTWLLTAPLYGKFERSLNTARFASTLAITTGSGVPILRALDTSRDTLTNVAMQELVAGGQRRRARGRQPGARAVGAKAFSADADPHDTRRRNHGRAAGHAGTRRQRAGAGPGTPHADHRRPAGAGPDPGHGRGGAADRAGRADADYRNQSARQIRNSRKP